MPPVHRDDTYHHLSTNGPVVREERTLESVHDLTKKAADRTSPIFLGRVVVRRDTDSCDHSSITEGSVYSEESDDYERDQEPDSKELLAQANERLRMQQLQDEIKSLKQLARDKDEKATQLTMQLRRATASKCDLVVACNDMEKQKEMAEQLGEAHARQMKLTNLTLMEARAQMEREFMNELAKLSWKMHDMERKHRNQVLEKDFEIAQLQEQMRRASLHVHRKKKQGKKS